VNIELNKAVLVTYLIVPYQMSSGCQKKTIAIYGQQVRTDIARPSCRSSSTPSAILLYVDAATQDIILSPHVGVWAEIL
jgi:hypothetical protein